MTNRALTALVGSLLLVFDSRIGCVGLHEFIQVSGVEGLELMLNGINHCHPPLLLSAGSHLA